MHGAQRRANGQSRIKEACPGQPQLASPSKGGAGEGLERWGDVVYNGIDSLTITGRRSLGEATRGVSRASRRRIAETFLKHLAWGHYPAGVKFHHLDTAGGHCPIHAVHQSANGGSQSRPR